MKLFKTLILIPILTMSSGFAASVTSDSADVEDIISVWATNYDKGNTDGLMALYTRNAVMFPPSSEILDSPDAIIAYLDGLKKVGVNKYSMSNVDMNIKGDIAYETALWEATRVDADGNVFKFGGNITNVLEKQKDGNWKIKFQSWN